MQVQRWRIHKLLHVDIGSAWHVAKLVCQVLGNLIILRLSFSYDLDIDRRRQAKVQDLANDVRRLEEKFNAGELPWKLIAQLLYVFGSRAVVLLAQGEQDFGIRSANAAGGAVRVVDGAIRQPDVIEHCYQLIFGNPVADIVFNFIAKARCFFNPKTSTAAHMHAENAGIHFGKEILTKEKYQPHRKHAKDQEGRNEDPAMLHGGLESAVVRLAQALKAMLKADLKALEWCGDAAPDPEFIFMLMAAKQVHYQRGHQRSREQIRSQHGKDHGFRQRHKEELGHAGQEKHGHKHNADAQRGDERRHGNLRCAVQNCLLQLFSLGKVSINVLYFNRRVIHKNANGQRQPPQGHDVERLAQSAKHDDGTKNG